MGRIVVQEFITLDGVVQAPGDPDEDRDGGFEYGGWQMNRADDTEFQEIIADWEGRTEALLLGRRTYEIFSSYWPFQDESAEGFMGELTARYNRVPKYVASTTLTTVEWANAELLGADVPGAVARLRDEPGGEIRVWGSTKLIHTLAEHDLVDEYRLAQYPLVLGTGKRLFPEGFPHTELARSESRTTASGVQVSVYRRPGD